MEAIKIVRTQIWERDLIFNDVVNSNEHGVRYSHGRAIFSSSGRNALILCGEIGAFASAGRFGTLHQHGFKRRIPFSGSAVVAFSGALMIAQTDPGLGAQMSLRGKTPHVCTDFRQNDLRAALSEKQDFDNRITF